MAKEGDKRGCWQAIRHKLEKKEAADMAKLLSMDYNVPANKIPQGSFGWMLAVPNDRIEEAELALSGTMPTPAEIISPEPSVTSPEPSAPPPVSSAAPKPQRRKRPAWHYGVIAAVSWALMALFIASDVDRWLPTVICGVGGWWYTAVFLMRR